ncbi:MULTISPECIES: SDR family oxidoreductase [Rhodococcus]|uniref:SDR family oxidoreductase n=1 Tax=Rhodococcus oxybenzonivorans TaxID=1990687 RepID=A0AAE4UZ28_9NOCA|nr:MULTISPECIES: SDR family oxidoreductase [Rhodococcus]MDV7240565.1 SDR family oxidoreductase [Rhodococcus oxybenzonivorans]MDV7265740.1 SDR family oxidoreductase [Rhodococcus oxybenzonivorans]MDV7272838.1 SDR family oxidoreductase [Rhodococcus oxybenzonivorans]MDV7333423.1 SDR family oxidoreductase [Rhodococcus oxybenzonivorans]MDV7342590.1 SDR family oxidoreductase [Rhodococcus oxybenzonivorans]
MTATSRKCAIVTGAGSGIGLATSSQLAESGWRVAMFDVNVIDQPAVLPGRYDTEHLALRVDVSDEAQVENAITHTVKAFGRLDAVVNSAAITLAEDSGILDVSTATFDRVLNVNLRGTFLMCKYALPELVASQGAIVNVSSAAAVMGLSSTAYPSSKGGVNALTRAIAHQMADAGVRCTSVMPGMVNTPMLDVAAGKPGSSVRATPGVIDRRAEPEEIARLISFLVSDDARFITGNSIAADGGLTKY